jgi:glutathione peroxidase
MRADLVVAGLCVVIAGCGSSSSDEGGEPAAARDATLQAAPGADHADRDRAVSRSAVKGKGDGGVLRGTYTRLNGVRDDLAGYRGDVVLVVNTATECGFTPQFEGLEALYREHRSEGLVVLGFPANDFAGQEPRSDEEIATFCKANYGVSFPMFAKSHVVGDGANPLFRKLNATAGEPEWNFNKYLVDRDGAVLARYGAGTEPDDPQLVERVEKLLAAKA